VGILETRNGRGGVAPRVWNTHIGRQIASSFNLWLSYLLLIAVSIVMISPLVWMALSSFKSRGEIESITLSLFPRQWLVSNYIEMSSKLDLLLLLRNSLIMTSLLVFAQLFTSSWAGFVFSKFTFKGSAIVFMAVLSTMMIPGTVTLIPLFILVTKLGLKNTLGGLVFPGLVSPFGIFMMRQFIDTLPGALIDAAKIDGCSDFRIYHSIMLPLLKPALAALGIFVFIASWDSFLWPIVILNDKAWRPLSVGLAFFVEENFSHTNLAMAGATIAVVPVIIFYVAFQRHFVEGLSMSGLAGF